MTETKALGLACASMLATSMLIGWLFFALGSGPLATILFGSVSGVGAYIAVFLLTKRGIAKTTTELPTEEESHA